LHPSSVDVVGWTVAVVAAAGAVATLVLAVGDVDDPDGETDGSATDVPPPGPAAVESSGDDEHAANAIAAIATAWIRPRRTTDPVWYGSPRRVRRLAARILCAPKPNHRNQV